MHRDIKMQNILVEFNVDKEITSVKLADFGFACENQLLKSNDNFCGTLVYMAPEQLMQNGVYDKRIDIWYLGHLFLELLIG